MHAVFCTFISGFGSAKIIEISQDLTELQVKCTPLHFMNHGKKCRF